jgi:hypothetical protein
LLGFRPLSGGGGLWIPYFRQEGGPSLIVEGREYGRLRLDKPSGDAKYLSPKGSGAQLYVPKNCGSFGKEVVVCEGEFKALSLSEAGIPAVAVGGISSAVPVIPALKKLLSKFSIETVYFLGDGDTALNFEFSREAVKLAGELPDVRLPRIPFGGPNGIDDCRKEFGGDFPAFWEGIKAGAVEVPVKSDASTIAAELLVPALEAIGKLKGGQKKYQAKILSLAGRLEPIALDEVAREVKKHFGISVMSFKEQAARTAKKLLPSSPVVLPEIHFDGKRYFRKNKDKTGYESIGREDVMLDLRRNGWPHRTAREMETSPCEDALYQLQLQNRVDYAGPFCGRPPGLYREKEVTVLCTQGPVMIEGKRGGDAGPVKDFLRSLLGEGRDAFFEVQRLTFYGWLKHSRTALRYYKQHLPGQILAFIGPPDSGKSLLQSIITQCLGGRQVDPSGYLVKGGNFNSEMWGAEHQALGDEEPVGEGRGGVHAFRERLKKAAVSIDFYFHAKFVDGKSARPVWRISLSGNDDSEAIAVVPLPTDSFADKIIYLQCYRRWSRITTGARRSKAFWQRLMGALPSFLWEVDSFELPKEMRGSRFFVREFHHPRVVELIDAASPVYVLGEALVLEAGKQGVKGFEGTAVELYGKLGSALSGISKSPAHLGHQLERLAKLEGWKDCISRDDQRVGPSRWHQTVWKIAVPTDPRF